MSHEIDTDRLASLVQERRSQSGQGLRATAKEIGVSSSTLGRVERGKLPDVDTFVRICRWLKVSPDSFVRETSEEEQGETPLGTLDEIAVHLRADRALTKETTEALMRMIRLAYEADSRNELESLSET